MSSFPVHSPENVHTFVQCSGIDSIKYPPKLGSPRDLLNEEQDNNSTVFSKFELGSHNINHALGYITNMHQLIHEFGLINAYVLIYHM